MFLWDTVWYIAYYVIDTDVVYVGNITLWSCVALPGEWLTVNTLIHFMSFTALAAVNVIDRQN